VRALYIKIKDMRRQHFAWTFLVTALVMLVYGVYSVFYCLNRKTDIPVLAIVFLIIGGVMLLVFGVLYLISRRQKMRYPASKGPIHPKKEEPEPEIEEEPQPEVKEEPKPVAPVVEKEMEPKAKEEPEPKEPEVEEEEPDDEEETSYYDEVVYEPAPAPRPFRGGNAYVKRLGYGPVLRVEGAEILDMRSNTYYRIEGNYVKRMGSGPVFEISGNRIRAAYGSYLYEISGTSISKVYGGFYASVNGNFINLFDLSVQYEMSGSLNNTQILVVAALLFGSY